MADLTSIFLFCGAAYMGLVSWIGNREIKQNDQFKAETKAKLEAHETKIQTIDNIQGTKLDILEKKMDKIEQAIETLASNIHREKNQEAQLTNAINMLYKFLESKQ
jgi:septal ring factor EnvC (AmiA/AmiB activator)